MKNLVERRWAFHSHRFLYSPVTWRLLFPDNSCIFDNDVYDDEGDEASSAHSDSIMDSDEEDKAYDWYYWSSVQWTNILLQFLSQGDRVGAV